MDSKGEPLKGGEITMSEKRNVNGNEVIVIISAEGVAKAVSEGKGLKGSSSKELETAALKQTGVDSLCQASSESSTTVAKSAPMSCPSPEVASLSPSRNMPPKAPNAKEALIRKRTLNRSLYSKQKSSFGEQPCPFDASMFEEEPNALLQEQASRKEVIVNIPTERNAKDARTVTGHTSTEGDEEAVSEGVTIMTKGIPEPVTEGKSLNGLSSKVRLSFSRRWTVLILFLGCLGTCLTVYQLEASKLLGFEKWKWCVLGMVLFSGMSVTNWVMHFTESLIERNSLFPEDVLYFFLGFKKSIQVFTWLAFVLLTWILLFYRGDQRSKIADRVLGYINWTLVSILIGSFLWFFKTLLLKILALSFHATTLFDRMQESIYHDYVLQTLSGRPLIEETRMVGREPSAGQLSFRTMKKGKMGKEIKKMIDVGKIYKLTQEKVSAWTMKMLVDAVTSSGLSIQSNDLHYSFDGGAEQVDKEITNEMEAMAAAYHIFRNVAQPGCKYFDEDDLQRFMIKEEVDLVFPLLEGAETGQINIKSLSDWVVKAYQGRKAVSHALNSTAISQLNKLVTGILIGTTVIVWLLLTEIATTNVLLLLWSQLFMAAFIFGNTCKTIFEAIIFVFITHPFDVGDGCVIDGVQLMVEDISILSTVFLKLDNEKIYYPNSVLATKPISNYYRSPDMGDKVEFSIESVSSRERIGSMKEKLKRYLEKNPQHWHPTHNVVVSEIENVNKMKMGLYVRHTMNYQDFAERNRRRTELVIELTRIFEELNIKYDLLPQEVHHPGLSEDKKQA